MSPTPSQCLMSLKYRELTCYVQGVELRTKRLCPTSNQHDDIQPDHGTPRPLRVAFASSDCALSSAYFW